jgi:small-conductance mechanosensitive channel
MEHLLQTTSELFHNLFTRDFLTELSAVAVAFSLAWALRRLVRSWLRRNDAPVAANWREQILEGAVIISPFLVALLLLFIARVVLHAIDLVSDFSDLALKLTAMLVIIRFGVYLLRLSLGSKNRLRLWENRLAFLVWAIVAINMLGWLDPVVHWLDSIGIGKGESRFTVWSVVKSLFIITLFILGGTWIARWIERRLMSVQGLAPGTRIGISKFSYSFLVALSILLGLSASGLDLTTLTVFAGAIGVGLGFGMQFLAANYMSGFALLMDRSIKPGDVISFTGMGGTSNEGFGWVQELRGRYVVVRDRDGVETLFPNQSFIVNPVINWSYTDPKVRLKLPVRITYQDDVELALEILLKAVESQRRILRDPPPVSRLMGFGDSGMELELRFWIADPQEGVNNVRSDVNRAIWRLFREHGITIPVSRQDVRLIGGLAGAGDKPAPTDA